MSIRIAGELVKQAKTQERARIRALILRHVRKQSSGNCCDNCRCCAIAGVLAALEPKK